jgi:hypothetical protein
VSECNREASIKRRTRPTVGCWAMEKDIGAIFKVQADKKVGLFEL